MADHKNAGTYRFACYVPAAHMPPLMRNWSIPRTPFAFPLLHRFTVRPFPDPILRKFFGHKPPGKTGPEIAKRLEASSTDFAAALNNTANQTRMERANMRQVCTML